MKNTNIFKDYTRFYLTAYESYDLKNVFDFEDAVADSSTEEETYVNIQSDENTEPVYKDIRGIVYTLLTVSILIGVPLLLYTYILRSKTCRSNWGEYNNRCYYSSVSLVSWEAASNACNQMKASLLWATDQDHAFLKSYSGDCFWTNVKIKHRNMTSLGSTSTDSIRIQLSVHVTHTTCTCYDHGIKATDCTYIKPYVCYMPK